MACGPIPQIYITIKTALLQIHTDLLSLCH